MAIVGATSEVATLKQALVEDEKRAATERIEREKYEAEVGKVRQELQALMEKHKSLERDSKTQASELAVVIENAKSSSPHPTPGGSSGIRPWQTWHFQ